MVVLKTDFVETWFWIKKIFVFSLSYSEKTFDKDYFKKILGNFSLTPQHKINTIIYQKHIPWSWRSLLTSKYLLKQNKIINVKRKTYRKTNIHSSFCSESNITIYCICTLCFYKNPKIYRLHFNRTTFSKLEFLLFDPKKP